MSIRSEMKAYIKSTSGISFNTLKTKYDQVDRFANFLQKNNIQLKGVKNIRTKDLKAYVDEQIKSGKDKRSIQNEIATLRGVLREYGRSQFVDKEENSNFSLGIGGASRKGTNQAIDKTSYITAKNKLDTKNTVLSQKASAALSLMYNLGLRSKEAVMSGKSLGDWERQIKNGERITVSHGTKGGKIRDVKIFDKESALNAIKTAQQVIDNNGNLFSGRSNTLESALNQMNNQMKSVFKDTDFSAHSARYAFAQSQVDDYKAEGYSAAEAYSQSSLDLGHGSERGRYIKHVYDQREAA